MTDAVKELLDAFLKVCPDVEPLTLVGAANALATFAQLRAYDSGGIETAEIAQTAGHAADLGAAIYALRGRVH